MLLRAWLDSTIPGMTPTREQLIGKHARLRGELAAAYDEPHDSFGRNGRIERISRELAEIELALMTGPVIDAAAAEMAASRND